MNLDGSGWVLMAQGQLRERVPREKRKKVPIRTLPLMKRLGTYCWGLFDRSELVLFHSQRAAVDEQSVNRASRSPALCYVWPRLRGLLKRVTGKRVCTSHLVHVREENEMNGIAGRGEMEVCT